VDLLLNDFPELLLGEVFTANNVVFLLAHIENGLVFHSWTGGLPYLSR